MRTSTIDLSGVDLNDVDSVESLWNNWVRQLFAEGFRPDEQPLPGPDPLILTYRLTPLCGINDFNRELAATA